MPSYEEEQEKEFFKVRRAGVEGRGRGGGVGARLVGEGATHVAMPQMPHLH